MAQSDARKEGVALPTFLRAAQGVGPRVIARSYEQTLLPDEAPQFVCRAPAGSVVALGRLDGAALRDLMDRAEQGLYERRALFMPLRPAPSVEAYVEQAVTLLAETALRLWPVWFTDVSFAMCGGGALGRSAADVIAREAANRAPGVRAAWAGRAARLALDGRAPRVEGVLPGVELGQLSLAIGNAGLILVVDAGIAAAGASNAAALVHALEWIAQHSHATVVALFPELPPLDPPFDRILFGARRVQAEGDAAPDNAGPDSEESVHPEAWLVPWRGAPHPLSEIEQRLAAMLGADGELAPLFRFNCVVDTVRGSRPRVDLVWIDGRLVVELDGYPDHSTPRAFIGDRQRDYELTLSGYAVLRLANEEIVQDYERAVAKIRDLVRWRRSQMNEEG